MEDVDGGGGVNAVAFAVAVTVFVCEGCNCDCAVFVMCKCTLLLAIAGFANSFTFADGDFFGAWFVVCVLNVVSFACTMLQLLWSTAAAINVVFFRVFNSCVTDVLLFVSSSVVILLM